MAGAREAGFEDAARGAAVSPSSLPGELCAAWDLLAGDERPWVWEKESGPSGEMAWIVIDEAPSSQVDVIVGAMREGRRLPSSLACLALSGGGFRGQGRRGWVAARGNLHLTTHHAVDLDASVAQAPLCMLPAAAAAAAVISVSEGSLRPSIKWVNDVLLGGGKVGGVLVRTQIEGERVKGVVFGIGLNVAVSPRIEPTPTVPLVSSLARAEPALAGSLSRLAEDVVSRLEGGLEVLADGEAESIFEQYRGFSNFLGRRATILLEEEKGGGVLAEGRVVELLPDLGLVMEGQIEPIRRGRMALRSGREHG